MLVPNFLCMIYSFLSCKLAASISTFPTFILSGKMCKSLWRSWKSSGYWKLTSKTYPSSLPALWLLMKSSLNWDIF